MTWIADEDGDFINLDKASLICFDYEQEEIDGVYQGVMCVMTVKIDEKTYTLGEFKNRDDAIEYLEENQWNE